MYISPRGRDLIAIADLWQSAGVSVVPALPRSKVVNLHWRQYEEKPAGPDLIRRWFAAGSNNLAVICGTGGLLVLDFDDLAYYQAWKIAAGELATTYTETTGRGTHVFFLVDQPVSKRFVECEALGVGHLCTVYPSIHPTGVFYFPVGNAAAPLLRAKTTKLFSILSEPETVVKNNESRESLNKYQSGAAVVPGGDVLSRIKSGFPIMRLASQLTELTVCGGGGRYLHGRCPFHPDEKPSFTVDLQRQLWKCYSPNCKGSSGGDVINLYALANNITVHEAIKRLAREVL